MAIFHLSVKVLSRSAGRSVVAAAAYRAAEKLRDQRLGMTHDYSRKGGVAHSEILAPATAPSWVLNRSTLWNTVEQTERRCDSQLARELTVALPVELSERQQVALLRRYVQRSFVDAGMVADCNIHRDNPDNPHAHVLLTMRTLGPEGFGKKCLAWNDRTLVTAWRSGWELEANRALVLAGHEQRIDARSYAEQGIEMEPTVKVGVAPRTQRQDSRDVVAERVAHNDQVRRQNGVAILAEPRVALRALTHQQATFTQPELERFLQQKTVDGAQYAACLKAVLASPALVQLPVSRGPHARMTSREMLQQECALMATAEALAKRRSDGRGSLVMARAVSAPGYGKLSAEQQAALRHVLADTGDLAVLEGYAGTGKTFMLNSARLAWEKDGRRVLGAALSGKAAAGLAEGAGMSARSLAAWEYAWQTGADRLGPRDVLVVDEAAMVGTRQMAHVFEQVAAAGAKVVLVGDSQQLQAIEAGAPFRAVGQRVGYGTLAHVQRQQTAWQRAATVHLAQGRVQHAVRAYAAQGAVHGHLRDEDARQAIVAAWHTHRQQAPKESSMLLAYTRADVAALNQRARALLQADGGLARSADVQTERGRKPMAVGERIVFLRNDRSLGVMNGSFGTLEKVRGNVLQVSVDSSRGEKRRVAFSTKDYNHVDYGYAATVHKAQGVTVDRSYALATPHWDRHATYVALSRHRKETQLHYAREQFPGGKAALTRCLSRSRSKDLALDHLHAPERAKVPVPQQKSQTVAERRVAAEMRVLSPWARAQTVAYAKKRVQQDTHAIWQAQSTSRRKEKTAEDFLRANPEVAQRKKAWDKQQLRYQTLLEDKASFKQSHPVRHFLGLTKTGKGQPCPSKQALQEAQDRADLAQSAYKQACLNPKHLRDAQQRAVDYNQETYRARDRLVALSRRSPPHQEKVALYERQSTALRKKQQVLEHAYEPLALRQQREQSLKLERGSDFSR